MTPPEGNMSSLRNVWKPAVAILMAFLIGRVVFSTDCAAVDCAATYSPTVWPDLFHRHCCAGPTFAHFLLAVTGLLVGAAVLWATIHLASRRRAPSH
ncbi:hypothetical protein [Gemmatimonas sp.]|jgi:H+/Cl- antiporter ClcA|uniref:hypothetical protein n=1 Tax=Gemmatimonas sp. TaxID=1962908 RepID=UPI0025B84871|nr:hypothetical protein [Gemmatimonas sp.]MCA2987535.1 hypothetical protein [Gemmatimonas sp.]MCA2990082.1 hypothetical protein [Gemmatimonas sp.]MCE2953860.1 hypothetical protein [Gemmatimonas sp.]